MTKRSRFRRLAVIALSTLTACTPAPPPESQPTRAVTMEASLPAMRSFAAKPAIQSTRANSEILNDFLDLSFRMESGRIVPRFTRFEGPIGVRVTGDANAQMVADLRSLLSRLRNEAAVDIYMTGGPTASITIEAIPKAELSRAVPRAACFVVPRVSSWEEFKAARRTPQVDWTTLERRDMATVFVPSDVAPQEIRDCLHEELAQALGPLNDLYRLPDSVFNDDNMHAVLTRFDMLVLRAYYDPALQNGMTRGEVAARLPAILSRLNPAGDRIAGQPRNDTSRDWIQLMSKALSDTNSPGQRRRAAESALNLTRAFGWHGTREGFSSFVYGRLEVGHNASLALGAFEAADRAYRSSGETRVQLAHVAVQLSAFALSSGDYHRVISLTDEAIPIAADHQNASLLATLMMFKSEALNALGHIGQSESVRLDSLAWARYGFGSERNVRARLQEIAALDPR